MDPIISFIKKYGDEILGVSQALTSILEGVALNTADAAKVRAVIEQLEKAHESIADSVDKGIPTVVISKDDITSIVHEWLNNNMAGIIAASMPAEIPNAENQTG